MSTKNSTIINNDSIIVTPISIRSRLNDMEDRANENIQHAISTITQLEQDDTKALEAHSRLLIAVFQEMKEIRTEIKAFTEQITNARSDIELKMHEILTAINKA